MDTVLRGIVREEFGLRQDDIRGHIGVRLVRVGIRQQFRDGKVRDWLAIHFLTGN